MTPDLPPPRRGRRDNGLPAAAFVPLADVDPRVGEHLLDLLKLAGVPAYLEPSSDVEPYTRAVALPSPPTDRLWVDREQHSAAREILENEARTSGAPTHPAQSGKRPADRGDRDSRPSAGLTDLDEERAWEEIVAGWDTALDSPVPPWPVVEDDDGAGPDGTADGPTAPGPQGRARNRSPRAPQPPPLDATPPAAPPTGPAPGGIDAPGDGPTAAGTAPEDEEEHYVPPPPPPVPRPSRQTVLGGLLILFGILLLAAPGLAGLDGASGFSFGVLSLLAGGTVLVLRLRNSRADDDPDDGAVV